MTRSMIVAFCLAILSLGLVAANARADQPLAESFLLEGKLDEGAAACLARLETHPRDDQARFGLAMIQFLQAFEHLTTDLYDHGLRTNRMTRGLPRQIRVLIPDNEQPEQMSYEAARRMIARMLADLKRAEATLAKIADPDVKLPLHVALIQMDVLGVDRPFRASFVLENFGVSTPNANINDFVITFDRGDVDWLRGYCHFLSGLCEVSLAVDWREMFERTGHLLFKDVETPHQFLLEGDEASDAFFFFTWPQLADIIAFVHLMRFPMEEPQRMKAAHAHFESTIHHSRMMWKHYQKETDDDNEWIPNPNQTGALRVAVSQKIVDQWLQTVDEAELVVRGEKLIPFWRGRNPRRGVNLKRVFTEPRTIDPVLWMQGTDATPYLEEGEITRFADPGTLRELNQTFGGFNFFRFAFWFN